MSLSEIFILVFGTPSSKYLYLGFPKPLEVGDHVDDGGDAGDLRDDVGGDHEHRALNYEDLQ